MEWKWKVNDGGCMPGPECVAIKMNKAEIDEVKFEK
jgi:hypothetical protein